MMIQDEFKETQQRLLKRYGVDAESSYIDIPSVTGRTHVLIAGDGPPVVLVPGFADPAALWTPLMAELTDFRLYVVDRPCFGLTGNASYRAETFKTLAVSFVREVLDAFGLDRPSFVGNSIGSNWELCFAIEHPERVKSMAHIGCPAFVLGTSAPLPLRLLSLPGVGRLITKLSKPSPKQVESFARTVAGADLSDKPELRDMLVAAQKMPGHTDCMLELLHAVITPGGARQEVALTAGDLRRVSQPTLLIWGENDRFGSQKIGTEVAKLIQGAEFEIVKGGGHVPWVDAPGDVGRLVAEYLGRP